MEQLASDPNNIVFAGARNPAGAEALQALAKKCSNVTIVKLDVKSLEDNKAAGQLVRDKAGKVDVVIANAGGLTRSAKVSTPQLTPCVRHRQPLPTLLAPSRPSPQRLCTPTLPPTPSVLFTSTKRPTT